MSNLLDALDLEDYFHRRFSKDLSDHFARLKFIDFILLKNFGNTFRDLRGSITSREIPSFTEWKELVLALPWNGQCSHLQGKRLILKLLKEL